MKPLTFALTLALAVSPALAMYSTDDALRPKWPCTGVDQTVHDSNGQTNRYSEAMSAWNDQTAASLAAEDYHGKVSCETDCEFPGCEKEVFWDFDDIDQTGSDPLNPAIKIFTIENFRVWGHCTECEGIDEIVID
ncbi:MAG: hypothetical protein ACI9C2_000659 [Gammaproteobacteria bacterium]|jgi:hypothetical protein